MSINLPAPQSHILSDIQIEEGMDYAKAFHAIYQTLDEESQIKVFFGFNQATRMATEIISSNNIEELEELTKKVWKITSYFRNKENAGNVGNLFLCLEKTLFVRLSKKRKIKKGRDESEKAMSKRFMQNPGKYIPGARILSLKVNGNSRPDFFLEINGERVIAELKSITFKARHLYQLQEYLDVYNISKGIAVAPALQCVLPENIQFVRMFA